MTDIEEPLAKRQPASLITLNVEIGFDAVLSNCLLYYLRSQGWPTSLIFWTSRFLINRKAAIYLDGYLGKLCPLHGCLPQGSPVFPILFQLFLQSLLAASPTSKTSCRQRYADNIGFLVSSPSLAQNMDVLEQVVQSVSTWCRQEHVSISHIKTELTHFSRSPTF